MRRQGFPDGEPHRDTVYCQACEGPGVVPTSLGVITDDGAIGDIAGFACQACGFIWPDAAAAPIITGQVDLGGRRAIDWLVAGLRALGCDPRPRCP